ncbi:unnamed protein product [Parajaminaea phylloscopi]
MLPFHSSNAYTLEHAKALLTRRPVSSPPSVLARHVGLVRRWVEDDNPTAAPLGTLLSGVSDAAIAKFVYARMPCPDLLYIRTIHDIIALGAAYPDSRAANVEGSYKIFTKFTSRGLEYYGSYTGMAADEVVGQRSLRHVQAFDLATSHRHNPRFVSPSSLTEAFGADASWGYGACPSLGSSPNQSTFSTDLSGLHRATTSQTFFCLTTVAPNLAAAEIRTLWQDITRRSFPPQFNTVVAHLVASLDEVVLCAFFNDVWCDFPGVDDLPYHPPHTFFGLNEAVPDTVSSLGGAGLTKVAQLAASAAEKETERLRKIEQRARALKAAYLDLYNRAPGLTAQIAAGHLTVVIAGDTYSAALPGEWGDGPTAVVVESLALSPSRKRKMAGPLGASKVASGWVDQWDMVVGGRPLDLSGLVISEGDSWDSLIGILAKCTAYNCALRAPHALKDPSPFAGFDDVVRRLLSRQGARLVGQDGVVEGIQMAEETRTWYGAVDKDDVSPDLGWRIPAPPSKLLNSHFQLVVRVDAPGNPRELRYVILAPGDASLPHAWSAFHEDSVWERILVNMVRVGLGLVRRRARQVKRGRPMTQLKSPYGTHHELAAAIAVKGPVFGTVSESNLSVVGVV